MWKVSVGTIFPGMFPGSLDFSCIGKERGSSWDLDVVDLRQFALDKHKTVDDDVFGGSGGMLLKPEIAHGFFKSCESMRKIYMSPRGKLFTQAMVEDLVGRDLCILCGRYEGVDQRPIEHWNAEEISIGDYVLHGGEVAAMVLVEACLRSIVVKGHSYKDDSLSNGLLECDQYTRPAVWSVDGKEYPVPPVLLSGNHAEIRKWRNANAMEVSIKRRGLS